MPKFCRRTLQGIYNFLMFMHQNICSVIICSLQKFKMLVT